MYKKIRDEFDRSINDITLANRLIDATDMETQLFEILRVSVSRGANCANIFRLGNYFYICLLNIGTDNLAAGSL